MQLSFWLDSVDMRMNTHEKTLRSISDYNYPLLTKYSDPFIRASCTYHPSPSHLSYFHKWGLVHDLSMSEIDCCRYLLGIWHLAVKWTLIPLVPLVVLTDTYFNAWRSRGGEYKFAHDMYFILPVCWAADEFLDDWNNPLEYFIYRYWQSKVSTNLGVWVSGMAMDVRAKEWLER